MNDIFVSYANGDRAVAQQLAGALEALGWSVWWDREIPFGTPFDQVIEEELNAARCSAQSVPAFLTEFRGVRVLRGAAGTTGAGTTEDVRERAMRCTMAGTHR